MVGSTQSHVVIAWIHFITIKKNYRTNLNYFWNIENYQDNLCPFLLINPWNPQVIYPLTFHLHSRHSFVTSWPNYSIYFARRVQQPAPPPPPAEYSNEPQNYQDNFCLFLLTNHATSRSSPLATFHLDSRHSLVTSWPNRSIYFARLVQQPAPSSLGEYSHAL